MSNQSYQHNIGARPFISPAPILSCAAEAVKCPGSGSLSFPKMFGPLFGITGPQHDPELKHARGEKAAEQMETLFKAFPHAFGFTTGLLRTADPITVSKPGETLSLKSSWIAAKSLYGLIVYRH